MLAEQSFAFRASAVAGSLMGVGAMYSGTSYLYGAFFEEDKLKALEFQDTFGTSFFLCTVLAIVLAGTALYTRPR